MSDGFITCLLVVALAAAGVWLVRAGRQRHALGLAVLGSIVFGWLTVSGLPVVLMLMVVAVLAVPWRAGPPAANRTTLLVGLLAMMAGVAALWSPSPTAAVLHASSWLLLAVWLAIFGIVVGQDRATVLVVLGYTAAVFLVQSVSVFVFRFSPSWEEAYYRSWISRPFVGDTGADMYNGSILTLNNAVEPARAAGILLVNVNRASMVLGVVCVVLIGAGVNWRSRALLASGGVVGAAILATGSKTGLVLVCGFPLLIGAIWLAKRAPTLIRILITVVATVSVALATWWVATTNQSLGTARRESLVPREYLWAEGWRAVTERPMLGLGFGGWEQRWAVGDVRVPFEEAVRPVHNWILQAWLDAGIVYALLNVMFAAWGILILVLILKMEHRVAVAVLAIAPVWVAVHGLADNSPMWGDSALIPVLAFALAVCLSFLPPRPRRSPTSRPASQASRGSLRNVAS